jgi:hypothetical protein
MSSTSPISRRRLLRLGAGAAAAAGVALATGVPARAATAPVTWPIVANGWSGFLQFNGRNSFGNSHGQGNAWDVRGGLHGFAFGDPALFFGWGSNGLNFVRLCDIRANVFQVYRTTKVLPGGSLEGTFQHYVYEPAVQCYTVTGPWPWHATWNGAPWNLPLTYGPVQTLGMLGFVLQVSRDATTWQSHLTHLHQSEAGDQRRLWGTVFDNAFVAWTEAYKYAPYSDAPTVASASPKYALIRPLDTNFQVFQVYRGHSTALRFTDDPHKIKYKFSWSGTNEALPAVNIETGGFQIPFTSWKSASSYYWFEDV